MAVKKKYKPKPVKFNKESLTKCIQSLRPFVENSVKSVWDVEIILTDEKLENEKWWAQTSYEVEPAMAKISFRCETWYEHEFESVWLAKKQVFTTLIHEFSHVRIQDYIMLFVQDSPCHRTTLHERICYMTNEIADVCLCDKKLFAYLRTQRF